VPLGRRGLRSSLPGLVEQSRQLFHGGRPVDAREVLDARLGWREGHGEALFLLDLGILEPLLRRLGAPG
jgi:hypothetical protein